jgi:outer membrane receptor protein involved in Fe transport
MNHAILAKNHNSDFLETSARGSIEASVLNVDFLNSRGRSMSRSLAVAAAFLFLTWLAAAQQPRTLKGTVYDSTGAAIQGARVEFRFNGASFISSTDNSGQFSITEESAGGTLEVSYPGFASFTTEIKPHASMENIQVVLSPAPALQRLQVKSTAEDRIPAVPISQYSISEEQINVSGSLVVDDVLRQAPGFSTFRRSSSLFANPSSQGVSLRGVGASATSRSTVLVDGIPLNDPFGGWIYWSRLPRQGIESMEVSNGGASDLYGGGALGGVVNLHTKRASEAFANGELSYGSLNTPDVSFAAGTPLGNWTISAMGQAFQTGGYIVVPPDQRGRVDSNANTGDLSGVVEIGHSLGERGRFFVRGSGFGESRDNGTPLQKNDTTIPELDLGSDWSSTKVGSISARLYGSTEYFHQTFSSVAPSRNFESLTNDQHSPSQQIGFVASWTRMFAEKHRVTAGMEAHDVRGHSAEENYRFVASSGQTVPTALVDAGGRQHSFGFFGQDAFLFAPDWVLTFGGRVDTWNNNTGYQNRTPLNGDPPTVRTFPARSESVFSPRVSLTHSFRNGIALNASVYQAFRAPTLNELYRNFRVGNTITLANPALTGEHLTGGEAGISAQRWQNRLTLRGNFFWSDITDPVANVTLTRTPSLITRQKENLGETRARGFEVSGQVQIKPRIQLSASYLFVSSTVVSFPPPPGGTSIVGNWLPQVPQNQFSVQASYLGNKWSAAAQARFLGNQFDDDQNLLPMGRAFTLDAQVSRQLLPHTSIFFAVQNLTDDRFAIAETPVTNVGPPIFVRGGVRFTLH